VLQRKGSSIVLGHYSPPHHGIESRYELELSQCEGDSLNQLEVGEVVIGLSVIQWCAAPDPIRRALRSG
jgi:hypothetical protein